MKKEEKNERCFSEEMQGQRWGIDSVNDILIGFIILCVKYQSATSRSNIFKNLPQGILTLGLSVLDHLDLPRANNFSSSDSGDQYWLSWAWRVFSKGSCFEWSEWGLGRVVEHMGDGAFHRKRSQQAASPVEKKVPDKRVLLVISFVWVISKTMPGWRRTGRWRTNRKYDE